MRLDYWNDPLVVSAFRVRFRGGTPSFIAVTYFVGLVALGGVLHYYLANQPKYSWISIYCVTVLAVETVVAGVSAMMATHRSMHYEVTNRTLDYQRIAAVPPRAILLGKLVGEPVQGYLMVLAGLPILVWCWGMGAVTIGTLVALVVQIATTAFLLGCVGLIYPLDTSGDKTVSAGRMLRIVVVVLGAMYSAPLAIMAPLVTHNPLTQLPIGFLTPVLSLVGLARGEAAADSLPFFDFRVPFLLITPFTQVVIGAVILHSIVRRMISPVNVALHKATAYLIVAILDVIVAGVMADPLTMTPTLEMRVAAFCVIHLGLSLTMMLAITPARECLRSWVWRYRGRQSWWRDLWLGERSENALALVTFCVLGLAATILLVILPEGVRQGATPDLLAMTGSFSHQLVVMCLLILSLGTLYQLLTSLGPAMSIFFVMGVALLVVVPHLAGAYLQLPELMATSPSAQFAHWIINEPPELPIWPLYVTYGGLFALARALLSRRLRLTIQVVDRTIAGMLATEAATA